MDIDSAYRLLLLKPIYFPLKDLLWGGEGPNISGILIRPILIWDSILTLLVIYEVTDFKSKA